MGPWTFRGVILPPVSSTTSHPAIIEFNGEWFIAYHTADAEGGNHFRRSVAIDHLEWDDSTTPARILPVDDDARARPDLTPRSNVAPWATSSASNEPIPTQYWIKSLNDELIRPNPLPPDMWGSWSGESPAAAVDPVRLGCPGARGQRTDQVLARRRARHRQRRLRPVVVVAAVLGRRRLARRAEPERLPDDDDRGATSVTFDAVTTSRLRAVLNASPNSASPPQYSALAVEEWEVHQAQPAGYAPVAVSTVVGVQPELPETVELDYGDVSVGAPVRWQAVDPADLAAAGTFTVQRLRRGVRGGNRRGDGHRARREPVACEPRAHRRTRGRVHGGIELPRRPERRHDRLHGRIARRGLGDAGRKTAPQPAGPVTPGPSRCGSTASSRTSGAIRPDQARVTASPSRSHGPCRRSSTASGARSPNPDAYPTEREAPNRVTFDPVVTTGIRVVLTAQSDGATNAAVGLSELEVLGEPLDTAAPEVALTLDGVDGAGDWYLSPVTVRATATDDRDLRTRIEVAVGDGEWVASDNVRFAEATVTGDGEHAVRARATDAAGNASAEASVTVRIDATRPTVTGQLDVEARTVCGHRGGCRVGCGGHRVRRRCADRLGRVHRARHGRRGEARRVPAGS